MVLTYLNRKLQIKWKFIHFIILLFAFGGLQAADLVNVQPVSNKILMLHFDEGHIDYNGVNAQTGEYESQTNNVVYYSLFDVTEGMKTSNYSIQSSNDGNYSSAKQPLYVNYKAKGTEFNGPANFPEFLREYFVYIVLPNAIVEGKEYSITLNGLADNYETYTFTFDPKKILSPTLKVNQVGFIPNQPKYAYMSQWMGTFNYGQHVNGALDLNEYATKDFYIYDINSKQIVKTYSNSIVLQQPKDGEDSRALGNWSQADVWSLDFSDFSTPGEYIIVVEDLGCTYPFEISDGAYWEPFRAAMRGIYYQRQGIVKRADEFGNKVYPRSHHPDDGIEYYYDPTRTGTGHENTNEGEFNYTDYPVDGIWGHYYDASDWDYYSHHHRVPLTMMVLYNLKPENFDDGDINNHYKLAESDPSWISEGGNGLPDLLDEARWMVDFYKRTVDALEAAGVGTGGMSGYVGREAGHNNASWKDDRKMAVKAELPEPTYYYAATAAYFAKSLNTYHKDILGNTSNHPEYNLWKTEAIDAYNWADSHDGADTSSHKEIAAAALFSITGNSAYEDDFYLCFQNDPQANHGAWVSPTNIMYASSIYLISCAEMADPAKYQDVKDFMVSKANSTMDGSDTRGYRFGGVQGFWQWQEMNLYTIPRTFLTSVAYELTGDQVYINDVYNTMAYVFGANQMGMSALSQVGDRFDRAPHCIDAWVINDYNDMVYYNPVWPGLSVYGRLTFHVNGPGSESWSRSSALPNVNDWPVGETRFESRYSISGSEYTIHQNNIWYIFGLGYLIDPGYNYSPNERPVISINLNEGQDVPFNSDLNLTVNASSDVRKVDYFYDWHYIGTSTDKINDFKYTWNVNIPADQSYRITAKAYDNKGLVNLPSDQVMKNIDVVPGSALYSINTSAFNGSIDKIPDQSQYNEGVSVTLKAVRDPYYNFVNWSGDAEGTTTTVEVLITKNMNITAVFESLGQYPAPMARWQLEDNFTDEVGDLNGVAEGNPQFVQGYEGKGVYFDKSSKINIGDGSTFPQRAEPRSVAMWVKAAHDSWTDAHTGDLFGYGDHHETDFLIRQQGPKFEVGTNWGNRVGFSNPWEKDTWIHLIVSYDGDTVRTYKNGVLHDVAKYLPLNTKSESNDAFIGAGAKNYWGTLDDVQFYNYALYPEEVNDVFNGNIGDGTGSGTSCTATGSILMERWDNISGTSVSQLTSNANYPDNPTSTSQLTQFKIPTNVADQYGVRVRGYLCAPQSGDYTFWITGDDNVELWLSTDDNPVNRTKIAYHTGWSSATDWNKFSTQQSSPVTLVEGQTYYIEAFMKEHGGGDNLSVGWLKPGESGTEPSEIIPGAVLSPATGTTPPPEDTEAPTAPSGLSANNIAQTSLNLTWNASTDNEVVTGYEVYQDGTALGTTQNTSYVVSNLTASTTYAMSVKAYDAAGNYSNTAQINVTTTDPVVSQSAFNGPHTIPGLIETEDYDNGGQNVAYYDGSSGNSGSAYRTNEDVDIQVCGEGGYNIGWTANGEWIEYTISSVNAGTYDINLRTASTNSNPGDIVVKLGDGPEGSNFITLGTFDAQYTGGWQTYETITLPGIELTGGSNKVLRLEYAGGNFNLDWIEFVSATPTGPQPIAHWTFENNFNDIVGNNDGTASGTVQFVSDSKDGNYAAYFDRNGEVNIGLTPDFPTGSNPRTVALWVKPAHDDWTDAVQADLFEYGDHHYNDFIIRQQGPKFTVGSNWGESVNLAGSIWETDVWMHLIVTYDGTNITSYKNGQLWDVQPLALSTTVGATDGIIGGGLKKYWGILDDVKFFDVAVNDTEASNLFNASKNGSTKRKILNKDQRMLKVYPNPVQKGSVMFLEYDFSEHSIVSVYNMFGAKMQEFRPGDVDLTELSFEKLKGGIYMIHVSGPQEVISRKVMFE